MTIKANDFVMSSYLLGYGNIELKDIAIKAIDKYNDVVYIWNALDENLNKLEDVLTKISEQNSYLSEEDKITKIEIIELGEE